MNLDTSGCITFLGISSDHLSIMVYDKVSLLPKAVKKTFSVTKAVYCGKAVFLDMLKLKQLFHISQYSMQSSTLIKGHSMLNMSFLCKKTSFLWFVYALSMLCILRFQRKDVRGKSSKHLYFLRSTFIKKSWELSFISETIWGQVRRSLQKYFVKYSVDPPCKELPHRSYPEDV